MGEGKSRGVGRRSKWIASVASVLLAASALAVGCALDDSAITSVGGGGDASLFDGGTPSEASDDGAPVCTPKTCANYPSDCHSSLADGCGKTIDCSAACPGGQACVPDGGPDSGASFFCNGPPVCNDAGEPGNSCGVLTNPGNGLQTNCGGCDAGFACASNTCGCAGTICSGANVCCQSASGTPNCNDSNNACCLRKACADDRTQCSTTFSNGCGGSLNCSSNCIGGQVCDTTNSACCTVSTTCGTNCNTTIQTNCHTDLTCGACGTGGTCDNTHHCCSNTVCNGTCCTAGQVCNANACCTRDSQGTTCGGKCGHLADNCNVDTVCPACADGDVCFNGPCACGSGGGQVNCPSGQTCHIAGGSGNGSCS